jgi:ribonuclease HI
MQKVIIITDSVCRNRVGSFASVLIHKGKKDINKRLVQGKFEDVTNQRASLQAVVDSLSVIKFPCEVVVKTDSDYVVKGVNLYLENWKENDWKRSDNKEIANIDLWKKCASLLSTHQVTAIKVKTPDRLVQLASEALNS